MTGDPEAKIHRCNTFFSRMHSRSEARTKKYIQHVSMFARHFDKSPESIGPEVYSDKRYWTRSLFS